MSDSSTHHNATFTWPPTASDRVVVTGTFDGWSGNTHVLTKDPKTGYFAATVPIKYGDKVAYKYVVDGQWMTREDEAKEWGKYDMRRGQAERISRETRLHGLRRHRLAYEELVSRVHRNAEIQAMQSEKVGTFVFQESRRPLETPLRSDPVVGRPRAMPLLFTRPLPHEIQFSAARPGAVSFESGVDHSEVEVDALTEYISARFTSLHGKLAVQRASRRHACERLSALLCLKTDFYFPSSRRLGRKHE
jgi:hypothetical protein